MGSGIQDDPSSSVPASPDAEEQAILWTIALRDAPADIIVQRQFQAWLTADPAHGIAWAEMAHVYDRLGDVEPAFAVRAPPAPKARPTIHPVAVAKRPRAWRGAAQLAGCTLCLTCLVAPSAMLRLRADHQSGVAEVQKISLADGSVVQLAPLSAIAVDYANGRRDVTLLKGEAFFTVTPDRRHPFRVIGERATITVLGTAFDVREVQDEAHPAFVGVEHGRVQVALMHGRPHLLTGGQAAAIGPAGAIQRQAIAPAQVAAWRARQLIVQDEPITEAIERLRPWFGGMIVTHGSALAQQRLTGIFNASDPVQALRGMARAYGGRVTMIGDWLIIYSQD
ncbi:FecR family protein [Sphingobium sp. YR768]|uniref:FecR family protein n=1 Tax=Sphingobium sp. YR768 TaxID=1884365 RepID=UPI0008ACDBA2|nr:FecR domain-containing protein [Sphingobium sp. YR768]SER25324.1 FecR family protein [Sphingobium sp. YR768]